LFFAPNFKFLPGDNDNLLAPLQHARQLAVEANLEATDKQKAYIDKSAMNHVYHKGQFILLEDFSFLNKNR